MALNRSDKSRILRRYFPGMTRNSEMSTEPSFPNVEEVCEQLLEAVGHTRPPTDLTAVCSLWPDLEVDEEDLDKPESTDGQGWTGRGHWKGERK